MNINRNTHQIEALLQESVSFLSNKYSFKLNLLVLHSRIIRFGNNGWPKIKCYNFRSKYIFIDIISTTHNATNFDDMVSPLCVGRK